MEQDKDIKTYFEVKAKAFDDIYDNKGGILTKIANRIFRKGMKERFDLTMKLCGNEKKTILDVGCGAGRFCIPLAEKGMEVIGLDYSEEMIKMAEEYLENYESKIGKRLDIIYMCCDFIQKFNPSKKADISIAMGVFDYLNDPVSFLKKMKKVTRKTIIASFPKKYTAQMPIRKLWLWTKNCHVYFYTLEDIKKIYAAAGIENYKIINVKAGYVVVSKI